MLKYGDISVVTWEDFSSGGAAGWLATPCCMANPLLTLNVPFGHVLFVGCGVCGNLISGLAVARESAMPDAKYLHPAGQTGMFVVKQPGCEDAPSVRVGDDRMAEVFSGDKIIWRFEIAAEASIAAWKQELGKGDL